MSKQEEKYFAINWCYCRLCLALEEIKEYKEYSALVHDIQVLINATKRLKEEAKPNDYKTY